MDEQTYSEPVGGQWEVDPKYHRISDFLGVNVYDRNDDKLVKKVLAIQDWAKQEGKSDDITKTLTEISKLQRKQGYQMIGKTLVNQLYQDIRLHQDQIRSQPQLPQQPKTVGKQIVKTQKPQSTIQKAVADTVQQSITGLVQKTLSDPKLIQGAVQNAVKEALK